MNCQSPQVLVRIERLIGLTLTLRVSTKMIFRSLFRVRYRWCLENRSKNRRVRLYPCRGAGEDGLIWEDKWQRRKAKLCGICARRQSCLLKDLLSKRLYQCIDFYSQRFHTKIFVTLFWESVKRFFPLLRHKWGMKILYWRRKDMLFYLQSI